MSVINQPISSTANKEHHRKKLLIGLTGVVGLAIIGAAAYWLLYGSKFVSTDNAYAAVEIAQVTPSVGGTISEVLVTDTQAVKKGSSRLTGERSLDLEKEIVRG